MSKTQPTEQNRVDLSLHLYVIPIHYEWIAILITAQCTADE